MDLEDDASIEQISKVKVVWELYEKKSPSIGMVNQLMDKTYPFRRSSILTEPQPVATILGDCPFIRSGDQVSCRLSKFVLFWTTVVM